MASAFTAGLDPCCGRQVEGSRCRAPHRSVERSCAITVPIPVPISIPGVQLHLLNRNVLTPPTFQTPLGMADTAGTPTVPSWIFIDRHTRSINI